MNISIWSVTAKEDPEETSLSKSLKNLNVDIDVNFVSENKSPLSKVYNQLLEVARKEEHDGIVLIHDDVWMEHDPRPKLENLFKQYDVVGVAGASQLHPQSPALWHIMGGRENLHGAVAHGNENKKQMTSFGPYPSRCVMIDGVFMAMNRNYTQNGGGFDEDCPSKWNFYDLLMSIDAHLNGFKVGVGDIMITHESPGLSEVTEDWKKGEKYFLSIYG